MHRRKETLVVIYKEKGHNKVKSWVNVIIRIIIKNPICLNRLHKSRIGKIYLQEKVNVLGQIK